MTAFPPLPAALAADGLRGGEGRLVSPLSLLLALGMTAGGAAGETLAQFEELFGMTEEQPVPMLTAVRAALPEGTRSANGIWFREDLLFQPHGNFLQKNAARVGAALEAAAFDEETLRRINEFVCRHTDGQIPVPACQKTRHRRGFSVIIEKKGCARWTDGKRILGKKS